MVRFFYLFINRTYLSLLHIGGQVVRIAKEDIFVNIDVPGATARQVSDFGDATGYGKIGG